MRQRTRCFAKFVRDRKLTAKRDIKVESGAGIIALHVREDGQVDVDMGAPQFEPSHIPFTAAARRAEAHEFILGLKDFQDRTGYDAHLGERSGQQRDDEAALYEDRVGDNHHHVICRVCGETADVD